MAKSTRSKTKRSFRAKKRADGVYAATEAARLHRLSMKLKVLTTTDKDGDVDVDAAEGDDEREDEVVAGEEMEKGGWQQFITWLGVIDPTEVEAENMKVLWEIMEGESN